MKFGAGAAGPFVQPGAAGQPQAAVRAGAQLVCVPHYVTTAGPLPSRWCDVANPYNEKALMCRALENTVYVAQANVAGPDQGSATAIVEFLY